MPRLRIPLVLAVALLSSVAPSLVAPAGAGIADKAVRVIQHNTDMGGPASALAEARSFGDVDAITFQELCQAQIPEVRAAGYQVMWRRQIQSPACAPDARGERWKGNAIATSRGLGAGKVQPLGTYGGRDFKMLCANITGAGVSRLWVCTTHLALGYKGARDGTANRTKQARKIAGLLNPWIADGRRVVLTGDLNDYPKSAPIDLLHRVRRDGTVGRVGRFWEGDQSDKAACGHDGLCRAMRPTTDVNKSGKRKAIDYFFAGYRGVNAHTGMSKGLVDSPTAGHWIVRGQVVFN